MNLAYIIAQAQGDSGMFSMVIMMGAIILIFYFMIIRPQKKQQKEREKMLSEIKVGDKVVTASGMHGKIAQLDEKTFILEVGNNVKIKFERSAVNMVLK